MATAADVPSETDLAWAAGFIDGEGCIHIARCTDSKRGYTNYQLVLRVSQRTTEPLEKLNALFGGFLSKHRGTTSPFRTQYIWGASNAMAGRIIELVLPYLVVKKEQAELALEFQEFRSANRNGRATDPKTGRFLPLDKTMHQEFYESMRGLKGVVAHG